MVGWKLLIWVGFKMIMVLKSGLVLWWLLDLIFWLMIVLIECVGYMGGCVIIL